MTILERVILAVETNISIAQYARLAISHTNQPQEMVFRKEPLRKGRVWEDGHVNVGNT